MSRVPRLLRSMHTGGRQIPHPATPSTSPSPHGHLPHSSLPSTASLASGSTTSPPLPLIPTLPSHSSSHRTSSKPLPRPRFTPKGKPIPHRPRRQIPVTLPSGRPEPLTWPPPKEYLQDIAAEVQRELDEGLPRPKPHPLWQFFHVPKSATIPIEEGSTPLDMGSLETTDSSDDTLARGRAWSAEELRTKSFGDLHTLWYVLLKERNVLATQKEERRRLNIRQEEGGDILNGRVLRCRKSMARIKYVLNERRLGLLAATLPHLDVPDSPHPPTPHIPSSLPHISDPLAAVDALHDRVDIPLDVLYARPRKTVDGTQAAAAEGESIFEEEGTPEQGSVADAQETVVDDGLVGKEEVESRDEGFGGGEEAKEFVNDVKVDDEGTVRKV